MNAIELQQQLDQLSAWRKKELALARALAEQARTPEEGKYLCRVWVLIIYAHCDNFLKETCRYYIEFIKNAPPNGYKVDLIWLAFKGKENFTEAADETYVSALGQNDNITAYFEAILSDAVFKKRRFKYKTLRFFCDCILQLSFDYTTKRMFCDRLLEKRNAIAHGEEAYVDQVTDCLKWHEETISFIDSLKDTVLNKVSVA